MKTRETINAMKLSPVEQAFLRQTIVKLHLKGLSAPEIANLLDAKNRHVQSTIKKYKEGGWENVALKTMGRPTGSNKTLTPQQEHEIKETLKTTRPEKFGLQGFLWDMRNVLALILLIFQLSVPRSTMSMYFVRWGFSPQRPVIRNYKQNPEHVRKWVEEEYPLIKLRAKEENADIFWGDETGIQNTCNYVRGYAPKGKTPEAKLSTERKLRVNMMSAITNQGKLRFMLYDGKMNQQRMMDFLKRLIKSNERKVYIILDNLSVHHGKILKAWAAENKNKIEIFHLPSYSPDLNPNELFNGTLKREIVKRGNATTEKKFVSNVRSSAMKIQRNKSLVKNLFNKKSASYAAAA